MGTMGMFVNAIEEKWISKTMNKMFVVYIKKQIVYYYYEYLERFVGFLWDNISIFIISIDSLKVGLVFQSNFFIIQVYSIVDCIPEDTKLCARTALQRIILNECVCGNIEV